MQHALAFIAAQCTYTARGMYANYHNETETIAFSHGMNSN